VEFVLCHSWRLEKLRAVSPWSEWKKGNLRGALKLAEQLDTSRCVLWHLHFIHQLRESDLNSARLCLGQLLQYQTRWPRLEKWQTKIALHWLPAMAKLDPVLFTRFVEAIWDDTDKNP